jgi:hypothetical protein
MKRPLGDMWNHRNLLSVFLLATMTLSAGCLSRGPVPVEGVVTGKHQIPSKGNPSKGVEGEETRYFLWLKTEDGPALVEVTEEVFRSVAEGQRVCVNCDSAKP